MSATRPCNNEKFYIYSDGTHTHTPCRKGGHESEDGNDHEMTKLPNRNTRRGTQKKTENKGEHQHQHT